MGCGEAAKPPDLFDGSKPNDKSFQLQKCDVYVTIIDSISMVRFSQEYRNVGSSDSTSTTYTFSVLAGAAICGFQMVRQDGTIVQGVVEKKDKARQQYKEALENKQAAALGEEQTKDRE
jgi:hypothetical protein